MLRALRVQQGYLEQGGLNRPHQVTVPSDPVGGLVGSRPADRPQPPESASDRCWPEGEPVRGMWDLRLARQAPERAGSPQERGRFGQPPCQFDLSLPQLSLADRYLWRSKRPSAPGATPGAGRASAG